MMNMNDWDKYEHLYENEFDWKCYFTKDEFDSIVDKALDSIEDTINHELSKGRDRIYINGIRGGRKTQKAAQMECGYAFIYKNYILHYNLKFWCPKAMFGWDDDTHIGENYNTLCLSSFIKSKVDEAREKHTLKLF